MQIDLLSQMCWRVICERARGYLRVGPASRERYVQDVASYVCVVLVESIGLKLVYVIVDGIIVVRRRFVRFRRKIRDE